MSVNHLAAFFVAFLLFALGVAIAVIAFRSRPLPVRSWAGAAILVMMCMSSGNGMFMTPFLTGVLGFDDRIGYSERGLNNTYYLTDDSGHRVQVAKGTYWAVYWYKRVSVGVFLLTFVVAVVYFVFVRQASSYEEVLS